MDVWGEQMVLDSYCKLWICEKIALSAKPNKAKYNELRYACMLEMQGCFSV